MATQSRHDSSGAASAARDYDEVDTSTYECNICYEVATEPVVTMCGHLYCWPCLYRYGSRQLLMPAAYASCSIDLSLCNVWYACRWMQVQHACKVCPVCKAGIAEDKVRPQTVTASRPCQACSCQYLQSRMLVLPQEALTANISSF